MNFSDLVASCRKTELRKNCKAHEELGRGDTAGCVKRGIGGRSCKSSRLNTESNRNTFVLSLVIKNRGLLICTTLGVPSCAAGQRGWVFCATQNSSP